MPRLPAPASRCSTTVGGTVAWQAFYIQSSWRDTHVLVASSFLSLPILTIGHGTPSARLIGCVLMGLVVGMLTIDSCFDLLVLTEASVQVGGDAYSGRMVAFLYYNAILNSPLVNGMLFSVMLTMALGAGVGFAHARVSRSAARERAWCHLVGLAILGHAGYIFCVIPRYLALRSAKTFIGADFDRWWLVLSARLVLAASSMAAALICMQLTTYGELRGSSRRENESTTRCGLSSMLPLRSSGRLSQTRERP